ncbi:MULTISPECIES: hypothetical protein [Fructilactobacillus]|uniref:Uncharacterized protein n=2 Tax=Fructilactobacillus TaxID=2767881 RepID=A0A9Q8ZQI4_9LACO|nr:MULTISPECIES: hypothetical protein [Fructilactobacillus]USS86758.1 hypothetical protein M3M38_01375 [Fructilactobacillus cliffordii]USS89754.1 hypothetical protein M3M40_02915 [Fructilactobacillus cliffordii]USS91196.1 hypothetical protein M3M37_03020 [Fructilactobacillus carniphilus]
MAKHKYLVPTTLLSLVGTAAYVFTKKRRRAQQIAIQDGLTEAIAAEFGDQDFSGYWIDFDNHAGLEYECGVSFINQETGLKESYSFLYNPDEQELYRIKPLSDQIN